MTNVQEFMVVKSGISVSLVGFEYVKMAIEIQVNDPHMNMGAIIQEISVKSNTSFHAVERSLNRAIQQGYPCMDQSVKDILFKNYAKVPTPKEYIRSIAYGIRNKII